MYVNEPELEIIYVRVFLKLSSGLKLPSANVRIGYFVRFLISLELGKNISFH